MQNHWLEKAKERTAREIAESLPDWWGKIKVRILPSITPDFSEYDAIADENGWLRFVKKNKEE